MKLCSFQREFGELAAARYAGPFQHRRRGRHLARTKREGSVGMWSARVFLNQGALTHNTWTSRLNFRRQASAVAGLNGENSSLQALSLSLSHALTHSLPTGPSHAHTHHAAVESSSKKEFCLFFSFFEWHLVQSAWYVWLDFSVRKQSAMLLSYCDYIGSRIHVLQVSTGQYYTQLSEPRPCQF